MSTLTRPRPADPGRRRLAGRITNLIIAIVAVAVVVTLCVAGGPGLPALGATFDPGTGVWTASSDGTLPTTQNLKVAGMSQPATVGFDANGVAHIKAATDADMFRALGYTQARFRIFQMDIMRRQADGQLAAILGHQAVDSDEYELDLGLGRAAQRDWDEMDKSSPAYSALVDFSAGVNAAIKQMTADHSLPMFVKLLDYSLKPWTPVDSLAVQRLVTQTLTMDDRPLAFSNILSALGQPTFDQWFQAAPQNEQYPMDPGPYKSLPLAPIPARDDGAPMPAGSAMSGGPAPQTVNGDATTQASWLDQGDAAVANTTAGVDALMDRMSDLPENATHTIGNSNAWVVSGTLTASGKPILAADPHLDLTLPSIWYQVELTSPSYHVSGVSIPGIPTVLLGKTDTFAFGITNSQHPGVFYYQEKTDSAHPDQYFWNGAWQKMAKINYTIDVKGGSPIKHPVELTVHGPVMTTYGITTSVWNVGTMPSDNLNSMLKLLQAHNFDEFHEALRGWETPAEDFAYAGADGNIGIVNAGYAPQVKAGSPWVIMPGTGEDDVIGTVPFDALPMSYNPPSGFTSTANQREVTAAYPYYWGRGYDFFDQGWREQQIDLGLAGKTGMTAAGMQQLQMSNTDGLAQALLPTVLNALDGQQLDPTSTTALNLLKSWNDNLDTNSAAAQVWLTFMTLYAYDVWNPVFAADKITKSKRTSVNPRSTGGSYAGDALNGLLLNISVSDQNNPLFSPAGIAPRTAPDVMRQAFQETVKSLSGKRGSDPTKWTVGGKHWVMIASLLQDSTLDAGPFPIGNNGRVVNTIVSVTPVRNGKTLTGVNTGGSSWRFVMDWGTGQASSIYPGGQSEDPMSPWYEDGVQSWLTNTQRPLIEGSAADAATKGRVWTLKG